MVSPEVKINPYSHLWGFYCFNNKNMNHAEPSTPRRIDQSDQTQNTILPFQRVSTIDPTHHIIYYQDEDRHLFGIRDHTDYRYLDMVSSRGMVIFKKNTPCGVICYKKEDLSLTKTNPEEFAKELLLENMVFISGSDFSSFHPWKSDYLTPEEFTLFLQDSFMIACWSGFSDMLEVILEQGEVEVLTLEKGFTSACNEGMLQIVIFLTQRYPEIVKNCSGVLPELVKNRQLCILEVLYDVNSELFEESWFSAEGVDEEVRGWWKEVSEW